MKTNKVQQTQVNLTIGSKFKWNFTDNRGTVTSDVQITQDDSMTKCGWVFSDVKSGHDCFRASHEEIIQAINSKVLIPIQIIPAKDTVPHATKEAQPVQAKKVPKVKKTQPAQASLPIPVPPVVSAPPPLPAPIQPTIPAPIPATKPAQVAPKVTEPTKTTSVPDGFTVVASCDAGVWKCFCGKTFQHFKQIGCHARIQHNPQEFTLVHLKGTPTIIGKNPKQQVARTVSTPALYATNESIEVWYERVLTPKETHAAVAALRVLSGRVPKVEHSGETNALITCVFVDSTCERA